MTENLAVAVGTPVPNLAACIRYQVHADAPVLSLILCTYNRTTELDTLFKSLSAQTFKDFEIIVVDQNPDDRILPMLDAALASGLDIRHLRQAVPNLSNARNIGIHAARGAWIGFPDDDCWYEADLLHVLSGSFSRTPAMAACAARWEQLPEPAEMPVDLSWERSRLFKDRMMVSFMLFFNRQVFERVGSFDTRLGVGQWYGAGEETDFVMRALRAGTSLRFHPTAVVHHPMKPHGSLADVRRRARGAGALYAKHELPFQVRLRGLVAPLLRAMLSGRRARDFLEAGMYTLGRWEGMREWRKMHSRAQSHPEPAVDMGELMHMTNEQPR